jgi:DNA-binding Xre family transcriptional regulator
VVGEDHRIGKGFGGTLISQFGAWRPITLATLLRICEAMEVKLIKILARLDRRSES